MIIQQIETSYRNFTESYLHNLHPSEIEYIGINFHEQANDPPIFKCYYSTKYSIQYDNEILRPFRKRDMIHSLNLIRDTKYSNTLRFEIGLYNRNNKNMKWLYEWIEHSFVLSPQQRDTLNHMAKWKCCSLSTHQFAALYYLGLITNTPTHFPLKAIKPHYILRTCENPNKIGKNYCVNLESILQFLKTTKIPALINLVDALSPIANDKNELWIVAMDFFSDPSITTKYKIYLKDKGGTLLSELERVILSYKLYSLAEQLATFATWLDKHETLKIYGVAVCLTEDGKWSINCYI